MGLYLLLLLTQGLYGEFHSELEGLGEGDVEGDRYLGYPVRLERWLMEGSYDRVWKAMKEGGVPCEEFGVFSEVCLFIIFLPAYPPPPYFEKLLTEFLLADPHLTNPLRNRLLFRARLSLPPALLDQVPPVPRLGGRRRRVCARARLGGQGRPYLFPVCSTAGGWRGGAGEGDEPDGD